MPYLLLEGYALLLAVCRFSGGVRTDEAKYLLDIPYPHPPFVRYLLSLLSGPLWTEFFLRALFATLVIQSVWLLLPRKKTYADWIVIGAWLLCGSIILQSGTIMMAPLTALSAVVLLAALRVPKLDQWQLFFVGCFWLLSLFTAYQAALLLPLVFAIFWRTKISIAQKALYVFGPLALLLLYTLTNPLALASMLNVAGKDASISFFMKVFALGKLLLLSGSGAIAIAGMVGLFLLKRWPEITTFLLITAYVFLSNQIYYGILFVPFFIIGVRDLLPRFGRNVQFGFLLLAVLFVPFLPYDTSPNVARDTSRALRLSSEDRLLIVGSFGHEWQYYSEAEVLRFTDLFDGSYDVVVCLSECPADIIQDMSRVPDVPVEAYQSL